MPAYFQSGSSTKFRRNPSIFIYLINYLIIYINLFILNKDAFQKKELKASLKLPANLLKGLY